MEKMKKTTIAIINWNGIRWLKKTLPKIIEFSKEANVVLIDNNSSDKSISFTKKNFKKIKIIKHKSNYGFAKGYNKAIKEIKSKYILLLNNDVIVTKNWLKPLITFLESNENFSVVQPKIKDLNNKKYFEYSGAAGGFIDFFGIPFCRGRIGNKLEKDTGQYNNSSEIFWGSGSCLLIKLDTFKKIGGFDENFFMHQEEIDLCWRIQGTGQKIGYCAKSTVYHYGGGTLTKRSYKKTFYNHRNNLLMLFKNLKISDFILIIINRLLIDIFISFYYLIKLNFTHSIMVYIAYVSFLLKIPMYLFFNKKKSEIRNPIQLEVKGRYDISIILISILKLDIFKKNK
tara:strand:- start:279 stop:1304 length:1026 start_codon:yes stop_codon:yes gene_type:complete